MPDELLTNQTSDSDASAGWAGSSDRSRRELLLSSLDPEMRRLHEKVLAGIAALDLAPLIAEVERRSEEQHEEVIRRLDVIGKTLQELLERQPAP